MPQRKSKVGLLGYGNYGKKIAQKLLEKERLKLVCKRTVNQENQVLAKQNGFQMTDDYQELLDDEKIAWVFVASPVNTHYKLVKNAILSKKNVFCEKPLAENNNKAQELVDLAAQKKVGLYVDDVFMYRECFLKLKSLLRDKKILSISFNWQKYGTFTDSLWNNLVYHDLYLSLNLLPKFSIKTITFKIIEEDKLKFEFQTECSKIFFHYDRTAKDKNIKSLEIVTQEAIYAWINDKLYLDQKLVFQEDPKSDALAEMIETVIGNKVNFELNKLQALEVLKIMESLQKSTESLASSQ